MIRLLITTLFVSSFFCSTVFAKEVQVVSEEAYVFSAPDFDSEPVGILPGGTKIQASEKPVGFFYKVKLPNGQTGYMPDSDLSVPLIGSGEPGPLAEEKFQAKPPKETLKEKSEGPKKSSPRLQKPLAQSTYLGVGFEYINYTEKVRGAERSEGIPFLSLKYLGKPKWAGGVSFLDISGLITGIVPTYYKDISGLFANGVIAIFNFTGQRMVPLTSSLTFTYGIGPSLKYSNISIPTFSGKTFVADDVTLGLVFNAGAVWQLDPTWMLRPDVRLYYDGVTQYSVGLAAGFSL